MSTNLTPDFKSMFPYNKSLMCYKVTHSFINFLFPTYLTKVSTKILVICPMTNILYTRFGIPYKNFSHSWMQLWPIYATDPSIMRSYNQLMEK